MTQNSSSSASSWLNRTTLGIGLTSLFSDWSHEIATAILPAFLASLGAGPGWLGVIEGTADGLSSFSKLAAGHYPLHFLCQQLLSSARHGAWIQLEQLGQSLIAPAAQLQRFQTGIQTALALVQQAREQDQ